MPLPTTSWVSLAQRLKHPATPFDRQLWQTMCKLRVALPCIVQSFDAARQTAVLQPAIREKINVPTDDGHGNFVPVPTDVTLPLLVDVAASLVGAGDYFITLPIQAGDECLVIFTDSCYNAWWTAGGVQNQEERRRHDLSDAIAIFGIRSQPRKIAGYSTSALQIRNTAGTVVIELGAGEISITAPTVNVTGATQVNVHSSTKVDINGSGSTVIEGKDWLTHKHTGVAAGGSNSGPVL